MSQTALSLLLTKLNRPPVPSDRIDRPRLIAALNNGLSGPLTIVSAGAGFGKTTLVSSWIEGLAVASRAAGFEVIPSAWLSLDPADSDLGVFLHYFAAAIRQAYPGRVWRNSRLASGTCSGVACVAAGHPCQ